MKKEDLKVRNRYKIEILNPEHSAFIQRMMIDYGFVWGAGTTDIKNTRYKYLVFYMNSLQILHAGSYSEADEMDMIKTDELMSLFLRKKVVSHKVKLNDDNDAIINTEDSTFTVGCQTFNITVAQEITDRYNQLKG